jgi:Putative MetA-pathway of phenol degradation
MTLINQSQEHRMKSIWTRISAFFVICAIAVGACGGENAAPADKGPYTVFNPTPPRLMREMSTDRPDTTESPYTVDAGHFQAEISFLDWTHDEQGGSEIDQFDVLPMNLKLGLLNNVDVQLLLDPYVYARVKVRGRGSFHDSGFGDTLLRAKVNLWGDDGGDTAFGVMPYVKFPTAGDDLGNDHVEGGLILPLTIRLPGEFSLATMAEFDVLRDDQDAGYGWGLLHSASLSHKIVGELEGFIEYVGFAPSDLGIGYQASVGTGVTYMLSPNLQIDAAVNVGISDSADDLSVTVGVSFRI